MRIDNADPLYLDEIGKTVFSFYFSDFPLKKDDVLHDELGNEYKIEAIGRAHGQNINMERIPMFGQFKKKLIGTELYTTRRMSQ